MITYRHTLEELAKGRKEMAAALAHFAGQGLTGQPPANAPWDDPRQFCAASKLLALIVLPRIGGWVVHVVFDLPPGPNGFASPDEGPFPTHDEALAHGRMIVRSLLRFAQSPLDTCETSQPSA